jgi:hypothetical protein
MSSGKKYDAYAVHHENGSWTARVVRRGTSRGTSAERERAGFENQQDAQRWADEQLCIYLAKIKERRARSRKNKSARRAALAARGAVLDKYSYRELAECSATEPDCLDELIAKTELLWQEIAFRMLKAGASEQEAYKEANSRVGRSKAERHRKALSGLLDAVSFGAKQIAAVNAQLILQRGARQGRHMTLDVQFAVGN